MLPPRDAQQLDLFAQAASDADAADGEDLDWDVGGQDDDEIDHGSVPFEHRKVSARSVAPPVTLAPASVFQMAASMLRTGGRFGNASGFRDAPPQRQRLTVERDGGVVRCTGAQYPSNRWDAERWEQERIRRAKQRPPKPTRKAKTRGKKLLEIIGQPDDEE